MQPDTPHLGPCPGDFNLAAFVLARADAAPDKVALAVIGDPAGEVLTYRALKSAVLGTAAGLGRLNLAAQSRVLLRLGNSPDFPICYLGCIAAGLVPVPTSAQLTRPEITRIAAELSPSLVIAAPEAAAPDHPAPVLPSARLAEFRNLPPAGFVLGDPDRPAYIIYTSGTSGSPRAVVHAHRAIWARQMMWQDWYGLAPSDRMLHAGAFNWTYTLGTGLMDPWAMGATALIPAPGTAATALPDLIAKNDVTIFAAAPGVYRQLLRSDLPAMPSLRHGLSAGEKMPQRLIDHWSKATGTAVHEAFGMSECSTFISGSPKRPAPTGSLGFPQSGRKVALLGPDGPVAQGDTGIIAIHKSDPGLMIGYLGQPEETAARYQGEWFLTGDLGRETAEGAILYEGRADDMMNAGGYRVSPLEIETALTEHPEIREAAACEVAVKADTTVIAVFYVANSAVTDSDLSAFAAARLARYKCPRLYIQVPALPRGANNKLLRRVLRQNWEAENGPT